VRSRLDSGSEAVVLSELLLRGFFVALLLRQFLVLIQETLFEFVVGCRVCAGLVQIAQGLRIGIELLGEFRSIRGSMRRDHGCF